MKNKIAIACCLLAFASLVAGALTFRTITIRIPATFSAEQEAFIIKSVLNQIEAEMLKTATVPTNVLSPIQTNIDQLLLTNSQPAKYFPTNKVAEPIVEP